MNTNLGKRHKQAVQVLNKVEYDSEGNPIGMMEDPSNPASANFGTLREPRRGGCYLGNGSAYITIAGLLSTDTVEVMEGSDLPTISNGRLDIASGDKVFGVKIFRAGELWGKYNCSENSGSIAYDSSGNGNHGQIINAITTTPEENPNSIHQYQDVYSFENEEGYSNNGSFDISKVPGMGRGAGALDIGLRYLKLDDSVNASYSAWFKFYDLQYNENIYWHSGSSWVFRSGYTYRIIIKVSEVSKGSFSLQLGRTSANRSVVISANGEYVLDIECFPASYAEYLYVIQNYCDARIEILNVEELGSKGIILPKDSSIQLPPFKDVLGNNLQYVGKVPGKAKFVGSSCFLSDGNAYLSGNVLTTDTITAHPESEVPVCTIDGRLDFPTVGGKYFDITIERGGSRVARLPLCEPIIDPSSHPYHDVSGNGNHATLMNGTLANDGKQDEFHYLQRGLKNDGVNQIIPILDDESGFADGSLLTDESVIQQDSHSFLNTGTELEAYDYPALKQADKDDDFWNENDGLGTVTPKPVQFDSLITQKGLSDKLFLDSSVSETIKNVRMYGNDLKGRQLNTENKLTNN